MLEFLEFLQLFVGVLKDIVTVISAFVAAVVAIRGLHIWKRQLKWKAEYELATKALQAIYKLKAAIAYVRSGLVQELELRESLSRVGINISDDDPHYRYRGEFATYHLRWQKIVDALQEVDVVMLEVEVYWGSSLESDVKLLQQKVNELGRAIYAHLDDVKNGIESYDDEIFKRELILTSPHDFIIPVEDEERENTIIYKRVILGSDEFGEEIDGVVANIRNFLRPYIYDRFIMGEEKFGIRDLLEMF